MSNIILAGFMGTGKTTVGQMVAERLGMPFVDLDDAIEAEAGKPVAAIFAEDGEKVFREFEARVARQFAQETGYVIATGGGTLLNQETRKAFESGHLLVCLTADPATITERVAGDPARPLARDPEILLALLGDRAALYASLPHHVETTGRQPGEAAGEVIRLWNQQQR